MPPSAALRARSQPPELRMGPVKILAIVLIVAGVLGLAYGTFTYTKETHTANVGPLTLSVKDKETVNVPLWASVGAIVAGVVLLVVGRNK
jgi:multidrug transporter EmrE-like cation transporter